MLEAVMELSGTRGAGSLTPAARELVRRRYDRAAPGDARTERLLALVESRRSQPRDHPPALDRRFVASRRCPTRSFNIRKGRSTT
jgi:hypothetical protein